MLLDRPPCLAQYLKPFFFPVQMYFSNVKNQPSAICLFPQAESARISWAGAGAQLTSHEPSALKTVGLQSLLGEYLNRLLCPNIPSRQLQSNSNMKTVLPILICLLMLTQADSTCLAGQYLQDGICEACHIKCVTCRDYLTCYVCKGANRVAGGCYCKQAHYDPGDVTADCQPCHYSCQACNSNTTCTACGESSNRALVSGTPFCTCLPKYIDVGSDLCASCDVSCATCNGTTANDCLTCNATADRTQVGSTCPCNSPLVSNIWTQPCCHYSCAKCISAYQCDGCHPDHHRMYNGSPLCVCMDGYYDDGFNTTCATCPQYCVTCSNNQTCSSCKPGYNREFNAVNSTCDCISGYKSNGNATCVPMVCNYTCKTCVTGTENQCATCDYQDRRQLVNGTCPCYDGYYDHGGNAFCQQCHFSCQTCSGSSTNCTSCETGVFRTFNATAGTCNCPTLYYFQYNQDVICARCQLDCYTCVSGYNCTSCRAADNRVMNNVTSRCDCIAGAYYDSEDRACYLCDSKCLTCSNRTACLTCDASLGRFLNTTTLMCDCRPGYIVSGQLCVETCQVSCKTCAANATRLCATCEWSTRRVFNASNQQCECPVAYYDDGFNANCTACHYSCATCVSSATNCTSCPFTRVLNAAAGTCDCYPGSYNTIYNQSQCQNCRSTCETCVIGTECASCSAAKRLVLDNSTKQCECMVGFYYDGDAGNCQACDYRCLTCSYTDNCLTCEPGWNRANPASLCPCFGPFYDNNASICVRCHYTCLTCTNGSQCLTCSNSTFRTLNNSTKLCACLSGYYDAGYDQDSSTPQACKPCRAGCATCTNSSNCLQCTNTSQFVNSTTFSCSSCHSSCLTCSGPASNNCLTCVFPKYLVSQMCVDVVCPFGKYVDLLGGCSACSELHENSLSCNIDEPLSCGPAFKLSQQECKTCNQVTGYALSNGQCKEICGDGYLIGYQCDDGNTLNGDGCSDSCSIEAGWRCDVVSNRSSCTLTAAVELTLLKMVKLPRKNVIRVTLQISLPLRLTSSNFAVSFSSLSASDFKTTIMPQSQSELRSITFEVEYKASLQNQRLTLSYSQSRRLQEIASVGASYGRPRLLPSVSFSANLDVTTFPPANYIASDSYGFYDMTSAAIFVLSLVLLLLNLVIAPKKYALHAVSVAWLVPYLYFTVFYSTGYTTDWLSPMASNLKYIALYFGFSFGPCCSSDSILGITSEVVSNAGAVIVILLVLWLAYLTIFLFTLKNKAEILAKALRMTKYLLLTFHAFFFYELIFASLNAFTKYANNNKVDGANLFIALVVLIGISFFLVYLWYVTATKFQANLKAASEKGTKQPSEKKVFADVQPNQPNLDHDESNIVIKMSNAKNELTNVGTSIHALSIPESALQQPAEEESSLLFDFCTLYSANRLAKYFLPVLLTKVFLFALFSATLTANPFAMLLLHLLLSTAFLIFVCAVRPFESRLTQAKLIVLEVLLIALQLPFAIYQFYGLKSVYLQSVESYLIVEIIFLLLAAVFFTIAEQCIVWKALLSELCGSLGVEGASRKVKDIPSLEEKKETIKIEEVLEKPVVVPKEEEAKSQQQFKEADLVRFAHSAGFAQNFRRERTRTAAEKTSEEQFA